MKNRHRINHPPTNIDERSDNTDGNERQKIFQKNRIPKTKCNHFICDDNLWSTLQMVSFFFRFQALLHNVFFRFFLSLSFVALPHSLPKYIQVIPYALCNHLRSMSHIRLNLCNIKMYNKLFYKCFGDSLNDLAIWKLGLVFNAIGVMLRPATLHAIHIDLFHWPYMYGITHI